MLCGAAMTRLKNIINIEIDFPFQDLMLGLGTLSSWHLSEYQQEEKAGSDPSLTAVGVDADFENENEHLVTSRGLLSGQFEEGLLTFEITDATDDRSHARIKLTVDYPQQIQNLFADRDRNWKTAVQSFDSRLVEVIRSLKASILDY
jgi:hypothetical protein